MPEEYRPVAKENIARAYAFIEKHLAGKQYMVGDRYSIADIYLFVVSNWTRFQQIDIAQWPNMKALQEHVRERPKVQEAMKAEGLIKT